MALFCSIYFVKITGSKSSLIQESNLIALYKGINHYISEDVFSLLGTCITEKQGRPELCFGTFIKLVFYDKALLRTV